VPLNVWTSTVRVENLITEAVLGLFLAEWATTHVFNDQMYIQQSALLVRALYDVVQLCATGGLQQTVVATVRDKRSINNLLQLLYFSLL
jgi:hypothetical protein